MPSPIMTGLRERRGDYLRTKKSSHGGDDGRGKRCLSLGSPRGRSVGAQVPANSSSLSLIDHHETFQLFGHDGPLGSDGAMETLW